MRKIFRRYRAVFFVALGLGILTLFNQELGLKAFSITGYSLKEMLLVIPPIFVLMGLLDVWVPRETMVKYMGEKSGILGVLLAFFIGSAAAGPLFGAFPVATVFMRKGVKFSNILIFIGAWSTTKIPMLLFEAASLGTAFALTRLLVDIPGIMLLAWLLTRLMKPEEVEELYRRAEDHSVKG